RATGFSLGRWGGAWRRLRRRGWRSRSCLLSGRGGRRGRACCCRLRRGARRARAVALGLLASARLRLILAFAEEVREVAAFRGFDIARAVKWARGQVEHPVRFEHEALPDRPGVRRTKRVRRHRRAVRVAYPDPRRDVTAVAEDDAIPELLARPRLYRGRTVDRKVRPPGTVVCENVRQHVGVGRIDRLALIRLRVLVYCLTARVLDLQH